MITRINELKSQTAIAEVKSLCESALNFISSAIYNGVTSDAQLEIERVALSNLFEGLEKHSTDKFVSEWLANQKRIYSLKHLGVRSAVNNLLEREGKYNGTLALILEEYSDRLKTTPEVLLYEEFISALSNFNYIPTVATELGAVADKVAQYRNDVDISKIIETMKDTRSNYLLPLIEDVVENYLNNKTESTKHILKETLVKFSYDPFIRDIINIVTLDATQLQLEYANAECDIDDKIFSPVIYLGESEVLFNVKGNYYIKKGNNVSKLQDEEIAKLDENFTHLCDIINYPNVEVTKKDIRIFIGNDNAVLTESETYVNGGLFTEKQVNESAEAAKWGGNTEFFTIVNILRENFNEIAELDFVKRVYLKENEQYGADVFKLRDNIFITTLDPINNKNTFYRNINPIQAEKIMMEHMRFDVSKTFESILPNKEKVLAEIDETKQEYADYIKLLEDRIEQFSNESSPAAVAVVEALNEELDEVKNDYKDYLNRVEEFISVSENLNITVQDDTSGKSYTVVVPTGAMAAKGEAGTGEEGAEGDAYGTEVGMSNMQAPDAAGGASSAVTFDDDKAELLSDQPSDDQDKVDLDADDVEAYADKVDAEKELEGGETDGDSGEVTSGDAGDAGLGGDATGDTGDATTDLSTDTTDLGGGTDDAGTSELDLTSDEPAPGEENTGEENKEPEKKEEGTGAPDQNLEKTNFKKDKNPDDLSEPKKIKKVFLKRPKKSQ